MKNYWALVICILLVVPGFAQQTETRKVGRFTGVKTAEGVDVYLRQGETEEVRVEVSNTSPSNVVTEVSGSYLKIHMRNGGRYNNVNAKVYVTYVSLERLSASSAGSIFSEGPIQSRSVDINVSSAGTVDVALDAGSVTVSAGSAGDVDLKGKVRKLIVEVSSAGEVNAYDLEAEEVEVEASSAGSAKVNVRKALVANASSGGNIRFRGNPERSVSNSSSGGTVRKTN